MLLGLQIDDGRLHYLGSLDIVAMAPAQRQTGTLISPIAGFMRAAALAWGQDRYGWDKACPLRPLRIVR